MKTLPLSLIVSFLAAATLRSESLLVPKIAGEWKAAAANSGEPAPEGLHDKPSDPFQIKIGDVWHCYYTAFPNDKASVYCRTSTDRQNWSERKLVASGGQAGEGTKEAQFPQVVEPEPGQYYLFRTQHSGKEAITGVYHSTDPMDFGVDGKNGDALHLITTLPAAISRVVKQDAAWLMTSADHRATKLEWQPVAVPTRPAPAPGRKIRVALYDDRGSAGKGVPSVSEQLGKATDVEVTKLDGNGIRAGLSGYDVVIFTGGSGSRQANTIGALGREQARRFVEVGGGYIGICAGAYLACDGFSWGIKVLDAKTPSPKWERGHADLKIETTDAGQSVLGLPKECVVIYHNGPILVPANDPEIPDFEPLVYFRSEVSKVPEQEGLQINTPALARGTYGKGRVLVSSPHPEQTQGMETWIVRAVHAVAAQ